MKRTAATRRRGQPPPTSRALARAVDWVRRGEPATARQELERLQRRAGDPALAVVIELARLETLRGDTAAARRLLAPARPPHARPAVEGDWLTAMALVHILDGQCGEASALLHAARLAKRRARVAVPAQLTALAVLAHLGLDELPQARALLERTRAGGEPLTTELHALLEAATDLRAGALVSCQSAAERALATLEARHDAPLRALAELLRARSLHAQGKLAACERALEKAEGILLDPGFSGLRGLCDIGAMLLSATRGRWREAQRRARLASARLPSSAWAWSETRWAHDPQQRAPASAPSESSSLAARAALREAERCLSQGEPAAAAAAASGAAAWYARSGARYDFAFALLAAAEARARLGAVAEAHHLLDECEAAAVEARYGLILVRSALVRAGLADRQGAFTDYAAALLRAARHAGEDSFGRAIKTACARIGLAPPALPQAPGQPWRLLVSRLGLDRPATHLLRLGERLFVRGPGDPLPPSVELVIDLDARELVRGTTRRRCPQRHAALMALLAAAGERGLGPEELFLRAWDSDVYHALRNRNALYVTLNRLRAGLTRRGLPARIEHGADGRYRLDGARGTAVRMALPSVKSRLFALPETPETVDDYATLARIPAAQAAWELGLRRAQAEAGVGFQA